MNREQLNNRIDEVCQNFHGQGHDLFQIVGIVVIGHKFGWRVVRLIVSRRVWSLTIKWFGDPKEWMVERGPLAYKSVGLKVVDRLGGYWDFIKGITPRDDLPAETRRMLD